MHVVVCEVYCESPGEAETSSMFARRRCSVRWREKPLPRSKLESYASAPSISFALRSLAVEQ